MLDYLAEIGYLPNAETKWEDLTALILDSGLGRDITGKELQRFIPNDLIAIQKPTK